MEPLKGLILSGGKGTRLRPITHTAPSSSCRSRTSRCCSTASRRWPPPGSSEIGIIVAPETGDEIEAAVGDGSRFGVRITYIPQDAPLGLAHAVLTAEPFLGDSPFVMYLGDNLLHDGIADAGRRVPRRTEPDALILLTPVPDPEHYGVAELEDGRVRARLVEKPQEPATDLALVGVYMFTPAILDAAQAIEPSARGELEITDAIQHLVDSGLRVEPHIVERLVEGHRPARGHARGQPPDPRHARARARRRARSTRRSTAASSSRRARGSSARPCAARRSSAPARVLTDAYIGPYTAIGDGCVIDARRGRALDPARGQRGRATSTRASRAA